jgi:hypothetical protein
MGYYDNSHVCGNCNGDGCRVCFGDLLDPSTGNLWKLRGQGLERFPLSLAVNECQPPYIQKSYASKLFWHKRGGVWFRTTPNRLIKHYKIPLCKPHP